MTGCGIAEEYHQGAETYLQHLPQEDEADLALIADQWGFFGAHISILIFEINQNKAETEDIRYFFLLLFYRSIVTRSKISGSDAAVIHVLLMLIGFCYTKKVCAADPLNCVKLLQLSHPLCDVF